MTTILANFKGTNRDYAFNLPEEITVEEGNLIESPTYPGSIIIVKQVLEKEYKFGNKNGELFEENEQDNLFRIKTLTDFKIKK